MSDPLSGRRLVLGVTGSAAAYKALTLASQASAAGALCDVILTEAAARLVQPLAFQALTHRPVVTSLWQPTGEMALDHITLARSADLALVAPATADVIARLAAGLADDALTTTLLACTAPLLIAPAMEPRMWAHAATRANARTLAERGAVFVGPEEGRMASGVTGLGRMSDPDLILESARHLLARDGVLAGRRVVVTAGPTREPIDPVRFLSNRSSGRMGYAAARVARDRGAEVTLITGPVALAAPIGVTVVAVETAEEMRRTVLERLADTDVLVMAAAVSDYRPAEYSPTKVKKGTTDEVLPLARNADILQEVAERCRAMSVGQRPVRIGFAAETNDLLTNAEAKRLAKDLDLVVANPVPESFGGDRHAATLIDGDGVTPLGEETKEAVAERMLDRALAILEARAGT